MDHHAQLLIGTRVWAFSCLAPEYHSPSTDVIHHTYQRMNIADARSLIREALFRPVGQSRRIFILEAVGILTEAQNALLKLFEEPNSHSVFYLIVPHEHILLPTLRSRFHLLGTEEQGVASNECTLFLTMSLSERLNEIANRLKKEDTHWVEEVVRGAIEYARTTHEVHTIKTVSQVDEYIRTVGASKKMLLEHLALSL